jgi:hypothetical protein
VPVLYSLVQYAHIVLYTNAKWGNLFPAQRI